MYLKWDEKVITNFADANINALYHQGYVFGRTEKGYVSQTRSLRIDLQKFELSSENRRILKKTDAIEIKTAALPYLDYHFSIGKLGKDFYDTKFGEKTPAPNRTSSAGTGSVFSANKIKELLTDNAKSNFNLLLSYSAAGETEPIGYAICYQNSELLHYCYPFYNLETKLPNLGLGMMTKAIVWAKEQGKKFVYLGSFQRPTDTYKLQFAGVEWWDGKKWKTDLNELKKIL